MCFMKNSKRRFWIILLTSATLLTLLGLGCAEIGEFFKEVPSTGVEAISKTIQDTATGQNGAGWSLPALGISLLGNFLLAWLRRRDQKVKRTLVKGISTIEKITEAELWNKIKEMLKEEQEKANVRDHIRKLVKEIKKDS